jgi:DNA helicase-2/ATP-dependent DNA helicase PcrA
MSHLADLNPEQQAAVTAAPGPVLVLAGPGSGKTRVLTRRAAYLVRELGAAPRTIMAVTFTNKAAREMALRIAALLEGSSHGLDGISLGTFHAFCARMLRREAELLPFTREFVIFDDADQQSLMRAVLGQLQVDSKQHSAASIHAAISRAKNELIEPEDLSRDTYFNEIVGRAYHRYQEQLLINNAVDFDDLLFWAVRLLQDHDDLRLAYRRRLEHILVDEFQDTNSAQYALLRLLAGFEPDLFVVGDPDQSIYRWRGADYRNVHRFQQDYPQARTVILEQNYRSTQTILDVAMAVIDRNPDRQKKRLFTERGRGEPVVLHESYDEGDEAAFVVESISLLVRDGYEPRDCAVMYRTNAQSRALEEMFLKAGLPYQIVGAQRFYGRREIKDLIAYLRVIHNPSDRVSLLRIINTPSRGIGDKTVALLLQLAEEGGEEPSGILLNLAASPEKAYADRLDTRARSALLSFAEPYARWVKARQNLTLIELVDLVLETSGYHAHIDDGTEEGIERWENVQELRQAAHDFGAVDLTTFLEHVALVSDQDTLSEEQNAPTLLTLHAAKGLEFPVVIIIGMDDGVLPHQRSFDDPEAMAEERRLFYVGVTRARDRLFLVRAFRRRLAGPSMLSEPSRFLYDIPSDLVQGELPGVQNWAQRDYRAQTQWDSPTRPAVQAHYRSGMRVRHPVFGEGIVIDTQLEFDDEEVAIEFEDAGVKHLVASLAQLEILEG